MSAKKVLFISWQAAMGHVTRDVAIAREMERLDPGVEISWLGNPLSARIIREAGGKLLPEWERVADYNLAGLEAVSDFSLDLMKYVSAAKAPREQNLILLKEILGKYDFDLIIGDEIYEVIIGMAEDRIRIPCPVIMIEDFIGHESMDKSLKIKMGIYLYSRKWIRSVKKTAGQVTHLFIGEPEDVPEKRFGFLLPGRRAFGRRYYRFAGHIVRFDPSEYADRAAVRKKLGYGDEPLVLCATGGTGVGRELLELCGRAYPLVKEQIPDIHMVYVCGELYSLEPPRLPEGADRHEYIPNIYEHFAAADLTVIVGGGTSTIELTALRRPFLFFPLENQFDQQHYVADRIVRHGAGVKMSYRDTMPETLAQAIVENIGREVTAKEFPADGARIVAETAMEKMMR